ncbi:MAG: RluA family pseudouridine synthase [Acidobacteriota bacterium]
MKKADNSEILRPELPSADLHEGARQNVAAQNTACRRDFTVTAEDAGARVDVLASSVFGITRSQIQHFIEKGLLTVKGLAVKPHYKAKPADIIALTIPEAGEKLVPQDLPVRVLYSDDFLVVLDKPAGMVVYPAAGHSSGTLMNAVARYSTKLASVGAPLRPGVVHRLDKDTSGVMVVAVDNGAYYGLVEQFRKRTIDRKYRAIVYGNLKADCGEISSRIGRSESDRKKMSTRTRRGKEAVTAWKVLERFGVATLIEAKLGTGRTHQIRVHFASVGHPVLGDSTYGKKTLLTIHGKKIAFPRQMLHAELLGFIHPATGEHMEFRTDLPQDMKEIVTTLRHTIGA